MTSPVSNLALPGRTLAAVGLVLLATIGLVGLPGTAAPAHADAKPSPFTLSVDHTTVRSGDSVTVTARAKSACSWLVEWNTDHRPGTGVQTVATFIAPTVSRRTPIAVVVSCFPPAAPAGQRTAAPRPAQARTSDDSEYLYVRVPARTQHSTVITVLPAGTVVSPPVTAGGPGGLLPNTGGPAFWLLLAGALAALAGTVVVRRAR